MIKNYFKIVMRNLVKNKTYSFINIFGLALGMAVAGLVGLWIQDELSFDRYHRNHARIAQVMTSDVINGDFLTYNEVSIPMGQELGTKYKADFEHVVLMSKEDQIILAAGDKRISGVGRWVDQAFPAMMTLTMLKGRQDALQDPSSILITQSLAQTLFGDNDPINQTIRLNNKDAVKVAGVYEDLPYNTSFHETKFLLPWEKFIVFRDLKEDQNQWFNHSFQLLVQLKDRVDFDKMTEKIRTIPQEHMKGTREEVMLHPMDRWHLYSTFENGKSAGGRIQFVWLFGIIGMFVLLLACINFMNLSTARSEKRAKEVGIRKAIGSLRGQLITQFLSESVVVACMAFLLSLCLVQLSLPFFNELADKQMSVPWANPLFWLAAAGFTIFTGVVSGSYPAFYLSGFTPIRVLKGVFNAGRFSSLPRKVLVVVQFTVSVALIIGTTIVFQQIKYAQDRPVGYSRERLITMPITTEELYSQYGPLREDLMQTGVVENMAESSSPSTHIFNNYSDPGWKGKSPDQNISFGMIAVTHDYGQTIGWQIREGRDFSRNFPADSGSFILNEAAVRVMGLKKPVGEIIQWGGKEQVVTGVVKDMVMESPYTPVKPTIFFLQYVWRNFVIIRLKPTVPTGTALSRIERILKKYNPESPFEYAFADEEYAKKFADEKRIANLATVFAVLAIFISCLGLFGLASFVAEQRTKEIGVRKVLGASVFHLWRMLSKDFVVLVVIACLIAIPLSSYFLNQWLQQYEYRTPVSWWIFAAAVICALIITLFTVSYQAVKAALMNPVRSLRTE